MQKSVSIIMSVYSETTEQLEKSIGSVLSQNFWNFEYIVVLDDPDNLAAKSYILDTQEKDTRIIFLENTQNIWQWPSLNRAIAKSQWKYIAIMDADDRNHSERIQKQYDFLEAHSSVDVLYTGWRQINEKWQIEERIPSAESFENIEKTFFYASPLLHASMMIRSSILKKHSYSDISRPADFLLFLEFIESGYTFSIIPEILYDYYIVEYDRGIQFSKIHTFSRNFLWVLSQKIWYFWNNPYFWWMFFITTVQWVLSRNKYIFFMSFNFLQKAYKKIFMK